jgi:hypothetical protein
MFLTGTRPLAHCSRGAANLIEWDAPCQLRQGSGSAVRVGISISTGDQSR